MYECIMCIEQQTLNLRIRKLVLIKNKKKKQGKN